MLAVLLAAGLTVAGWFTFGTRGSDSTQAARRPAPSASCVRALLADWADGRIDRTYPIGCYRAAMRSLPTDLEMYSSAPDDIASALRDRIVQSTAARKSP